MPAGRPDRMWRQCYGYLRRAQYRGGRPAGSIFLLDQAPRARARRMGLHLRGRRLQSDATAQAHGGADMSAAAHSQLAGRWRIVEADLWDRYYLDLCGPAVIAIGADGRGEIAFGAMQGTLDMQYSEFSIGLTL